MSFEIRFGKNRWWMLLRRFRWCKSQRRARNWNAAQLVDREAQDWMYGDATSDDPQATEGTGS